MEKALIRVFRAKIQNPIEQINPIQALKITPTIVGALNILEIIRIIMGKTFEILKAQIKIYD